MHPHHRSCCQHPRASLHRSSSPAVFGREMHFIRPGPPILLGGPEVPPCCGLPVSIHQVTQHGLSGDYRPTLPARHSLSLPFCICLPHPRQPPTVARFGPVSSPRPTGVTGHADCLPDISPQAYPVGDGYQGAESALEPGGVRRDDHIVFGVENRRLVSSLPSRLSFLLSLFDYPIYPVPDDRVHHHIEDCGGQRVALCNSPRPLKRFSVVSACPRHHGEAAPIGCQ